MGLVASGSSIGGVIFPLVLSKLLNGSDIGFGWSIRIVAFIMLPFMLFACAIVRPRVPPRKTTVFIAAPWKDARYILLIVAMFCIMMGMWTPVFYIPTYAVHRGMNSTLAAYLLAIVNASSTFGRILPGFLADRFGAMNLYSLAALGTGIVISCLNEPTTNGAIIVYCVFYGFISGTIIPSSSAAISMCTKDPRNLGTYMGMGMGVATIAVLIGPQVSGALYERYGGFSQVSIYSGMFSIFGGLVVLASKSFTPEGLFGKV
jgi:MFS family permease